MKICEVDIFGEKYSLRAEMDDTFVRDLARYVDSRMREVANASPSASPLQVAVLAALDIASERTPPAEAGEENSQKVLALADDVETRARRMLERISRASPEIQNA